MAGGIVVSLPARSVCPKEASRRMDRYETAPSKAVCLSDGSPTHAAGWFLYSSTLESTPSADRQKDPAGPEGTGPVGVNVPPACCNGSPWSALGPRARASPGRENCRSGEAGVALRVLPQRSNSRVPAQLVWWFVVHIPFSSRRMDCLRVLGCLPSSPGTGRQDAHDPRLCGTATPRFDPGATAVLLLGIPICPPPARRRSVGIHSGC